jgi:hypothetical protein
MPNLLLYESVKLMCSPEFALEMTHLAPNPLLSLTGDAVTWFSDVLIFKHYYLNRMLLILFV